MRRQVRNPLDSETRISLPARRMNYILCVDIHARAGKKIIHSDSWDFLHLLSALYPVQIITLDALEMFGAQYSVLEI